MVGPSPSGGGFSFAGVPFQGHCCCLYEDAQQRMAILTELFRAALARREKCIHVAHGHIVGALKNSLRAAGVDVEAALESGALELSGAEETYCRMGVPDRSRLTSVWRQAARRAERKGFTGLSVASDAPRSAFGGPHASRWLEYERSLTQTVSVLGGTFLCVYSRRAISLRAALEVLRAHPAGLASGIIGRSVYYERAERARRSGRRLRRERSNEHQVAWATAEMDRLGGAGIARASRLFTMGALTASIVHEVRQPLAAIAANANAGLRWLEATRPRVNLARRSLARVLRDANRAADIITHIRSLATRATTAGRRSLHINTVVHRVVALIEEEVRRADAVLRLELAANIPRVVADEVHLQQVMLNLLTNALEAMENVTGWPKEVAILTQRGANGYVIVTVRDSGRSARSESLARAFEPFYTTKPHGMGVGLSISRAIVEEHGGRLWATRNEDHGAAFHFSLPPGQGTRR